MTEYQNVIKALSKKPKVWLITGVAGFIGSNLLEALLNANQKVIGIDNYSTGFLKNLEHVKDGVGDIIWKNFELIESGDIRDREKCLSAMEGIDYVLHQAALGSVPRSLKTPLTTHENNVNGHLNILEAARYSGVKRVIYASSSSIYGDIKDSPKEEIRVGKTLSPYALSKKINEQYSWQYWKNFQLESVGLRYFNVFGKRQNPSGEYAAVIPKWISQIMNNGVVEIHGDGDTSRDFCYIENVVQANILAAVSSKVNGQSSVFNIACGKTTTLNELFLEIRKYFPQYQKDPIFTSFRKGDVRNSLASIKNAYNSIGYEPAYDFKEGLELTINWFKENQK